jgi:hypothetical protein
MELYSSNKLNKKMRIQIVAVRKNKRGLLEEREEGWGADLTKATH